MSHDHDQQNIDYRTTLDVARFHNALAREQPERVAESRPASLWVALGAIAVAAIGASSYGTNKSLAADANGLVNYNKFGLAYNPVAPPALVPEGPGDVVDPFKAGMKVYASKGCVACHQPQGGGSPGVYPPLDGSEWVIHGTERLAYAIDFGISGPITVKGATYNGAMPPHRATLSAKELAHVMTYIRGAWSNQASPVSVEAVQEFRQRIPEHAIMNEAQLKAIPEDQDLGGGEAPAAAPAP